MHSVAGTAKTLAARHEATESCIQQVLARHLDQQLSRGLPLRCPPVTNYRVHGVVDSLRCAHVDVVCARIQEPLLPAKLQRRVPGCLAGCRVSVIVPLTLLRKQLPPRRSANSTPSLRASACTLPVPSLPGHVACRTLAWSRLTVRSKPVHLLQGRAGLGGEAACWTDGQHLSARSALRGRPRAVNASSRLVMASLERLNRGKRACQEQLLLGPCLAYRWSSPGAALCSGECMIENLPQHDTVIPRLIYPAPLGPGSQAAVGLTSTAMGDLAGISGAVSFCQFLWLSLYSPV